MKVAGIDLTSASDLATACLALPLGYFAWLMYGDPTLVSPQVVSGLAVPTAVGIKKLAESGSFLARIRHWEALRELERARRAVEPWSLQNRTTRSESLRQLSALLQGAVELPRRQRLTALIVDATEDAELQDTRKRLLALQDELEDAGMSAGQRVVTTTSTIDHEIRRFMTKTPEIAALNHLAQLAPMLTAEQIRAELTKVKQNLVDKGPLELDRSQAAQNPLKQLPKSATTEAELIP